MYINNYNYNRCYIQQNLDPVNIMKEVILTCGIKTINIMSKIIYKAINGFR
jgi:hypothetical protein